MFNFKNIITFSWIRNFRSGSGSNTVVSNPHQWVVAPDTNLPVLYQADEAVCRSDRQVQDAEEERPPGVDAEPREGHLELDGHLPAGVHRPAEEHKRRAH